MQSALRTVHGGFVAVSCLCIDRHSQSQRVPEGSGVREDSRPPDCAVPGEPSPQLRSAGVGTRPVVRASPQRSGLWRACCRSQGALVLRRLTEGRRAPSHTDSVLRRKRSRAVGGSALPAPSLPRPLWGLSPAPPPPALGLLPEHLRSGPCTPFWSVHPAGHPLRSSGHPRPRRSQRALSECLVLSGPRSSPQGLPG